MAVCKAAKVLLAFIDKNKHKWTITSAIIDEEKNIVQLFVNTANPNGRLAV